jgi:phage gp36-like protein
MAHYAQSSDITALYGEALLVRVSDQNKDRQADPEVVEAGLEAADDIIDAYLSSQYTVPLAYVSKSVRKLAVDIAVYTMAMGRAERTEEMRLRYEDAMAMLKMMAAGKIGLGLPPVDTNGDGVPESDPNRKRKGRIFDISRG